MKTIHNGINCNKLRIVSLINQSINPIWNDIVSSWERYFLINHVFDTSENINKYLNQKIDFLFLFIDSNQTFKSSYYNFLKNQNLKFDFIIIKPWFEIESDIKHFKSLADDIVYLEYGFRWLKWKTISILRKYWETHSKPTTIIYKNIIADFIDNSIWLEGQKINLTPKEYKLFRYLLENRGKFKTRDEILKSVWEYQDDNDNTRVIDQIIFKIKQKIGHEYFIVSRREGIKFE